MFFSPKSARIFGALADGLPTEDLTAFCISPATAQALSPMSFAPCRRGVAAQPGGDAGPAGLKTGCSMTRPGRVPCRTGRLSLTAARGGYSNPPHRFDPRYPEIQTSACGKARPLCRLRSCSMRLSPTPKTLAAPISSPAPAASAAPARMRPMPITNLGAPMTRCSPATASARPPYAALDSRLSTLPLEELNRRQQACEQSFLHQGITFTVYSDNRATERIIPTDLLPRIVTASGMGPHRARPDPAHPSPSICSCATSTATAGC